MAPENDPASQNELLARLDRLQAERDALHHELVAIRATRYWRMREVLVPPNSTRAKMARALIRTAKVPPRLAKRALRAAKSGATVGVSFLRGGTKLAALKASEIKNRQAAERAIASGAGARLIAAAVVPKSLQVSSVNYVVIEGWYALNGRAEKLEIEYEGGRVPVESFGFPIYPGSPANFGELPPNSCGFRVPIFVDRSMLGRELHFRLWATVKGSGALEADLGSTEIISPRPAISAEVPAVDSKEPLIAILMATYRPERKLFVRQIESIIAQTHKNWICLILDDCSPASYFSMIKTVIQRDSRFIAAQNENNLGFYGNFEALLQSVPEGIEFIALSDQDDKWFPEKLETLLANLGDKMLVYSDMRIATETGEVLQETYWKFRENNFDRGDALFLANTVTGAASLMRRSLLDLALPFPPRTADAYHDHWLGLCAWAAGGMAYVDKPLYDYVQHGGNVIGLCGPDHYSWRMNLRQLLYATAGGSQSPPFTRQHVTQMVKLEEFALRKTLWAQLLLKRSANLNPEAIDCIRRFAELGASPKKWLRHSLGYVKNRTLTLGREWYALHGVYARRAAAKFLPGSVPPPPQQVNSPNTPAVMQTAVLSSEFLGKKTEAIPLDVTSEEPVRVNMVVSTIDFKHFFGGYISVFNIALRLAKAGVRMRMVTTDACDGDPSEWKEEIAEFGDLKDFFDYVEVFKAFDRKEKLPVNPRDSFLATSWWTAHIAHQAAAQLGPRPFVYLTQDYEPTFYPNDSIRALAEASYRLPHRALFSTELLRSYSRRHGIGVYAEGEILGDLNSSAFENAINPSPVDSEAMRNRKFKSVLFYARPDNHAGRNLFPMGFAALRELAEEGVLDDGWKVFGMGTSDSGYKVPLANGHYLNILGKMGLDSYYQTIPDYDVGLALMLTPHPSLVPLDMAAAGLVTVTNYYETKTTEAMRAISPNIIATEPTIEGIKQGLKEAFSRASDIDGRIAGSKINWARSWDEALPNDLIEKLICWLEFPVGERESMGHP